MKRQDEGVAYLGKDVGRVLHILHVDFPPGKVLFSFSRCNQIRSTLTNTVDVAQHGLCHPICNNSHVQSCADSSRKRLTFSSPDFLTCTTTPL